ncbi:uncharacterized protein TrAFT101_010938 [Trichoderma asperellum]|uniref:Zn(2)-C6 fungal-type domain-containing protein n=1 Tax=Trichoderma asperellum (strain ATCC 204424 / CBS 433.97 / NBRC 101777) TaxID=1042311 RepID=A0A2T3YXD3_TRIA4|nr:hypothetical protein M441DRAFT_149611 [Trichoderma asperellum CBS 433.97]PTB37202.1 hypothetical protein M441DRAFT_149611 [Trichoderma asperellum CBS 433.97]UKZ96138.1 hypothetical protein TrAFT101_010938 [Trichoderma asperellum]
MFYTISYNNGSAEADSVSKMASNHTFGEYRQSRLACIECRARKVKCSGESTGCQRCQGTGITCVFPERTKRGTKRRKNSPPTDSHDSTKGGSSSETSLKNGESGSSTSAAPIGDSHPLASTVPTSEFSPSLDFSPSYFSLDLSDSFNIDLDQLNSTLGDLSSLASSNSISPSQSQPFPAAPRRTLRTTEGLCLGDSPSIKDGNLCACAQSALHMLEELELQYENNVDVSSDTILGYQKIALARLNSWISCDHSQTPRATTKLIVLVIEGLSLYLERGAANCIRQMRQEVEDENPSAAARLCNVGDYHVESKHEWAHILRVSLLVRCRELLAAVTRLKQHDVNDVFLPAVETRLSSVIQELKGWEDYL